MNRRRAIYPLGHGEAVVRAYRWRTAENSAAYLLPHLRPGMSVLDVGCGPGSVTIDLAGRVAPGRVTATDLSEEVLAQARAEATAQGVATIDFVVANAEALDLPADTFDVVHAHQVLQHLADPVQALREMGRVARPGGLVAVRDADYAAFAWWPRLPELDSWRSLYSTAARVNGHQLDAGRRLLSWALDAGFTDVTAGSSTWCLATPEDRGWWGATWADRVLTSPFTRQLLDSGLATTADLEAISDAWLRWAQEPDGWLSVLHGELLARVAEHPPAAKGDPS